MHLTRRGAVYVSHLRLGSANASVSSGFHRASGSKQTIYDFDVKGADHKVYNLAQHKGHPLLIYNVASQCGYTKGGYQTATTLYNRYKEKGFTVLAFPCNQFGGQEPGTEEDIQTFACTKFSAEFPIMEKVKVNGSDAHPLFEYLKKTVPGLLGTKAVKWNFTSFLVNGEGVPVARFSPGTSAADIEKQLLPLLTSPTQSSIKASE